MFEILLISIGEQTHLILSMILLLTVAGRGSTSFWRAATPFSCPEIWSPRRRCLAPRGCSAPPKIQQQQNRQQHKETQQEKQKSSNNYTTFFLKDQREIIVSKPLKEYDVMFEGMSFFRAHQSHLINLNHFIRYDKKEGGYAILSDQSTIPVSNKKKDLMFKALEEFPKSA